MLSMNSTVKEVTDNAEIAKIIEEYIPNFQKYKEFQLIKNFKIKFLIGKGKMVGLTPEQEHEMMERIQEYFDAHNK